LKRNSKYFRRAGSRSEKEGVFLYMCGRDVVASFCVLRDKFAVFKAGIVVPTRDVFGIEGKGREGKGREGEKKGVSSEDAHHVSEFRGDYARNLARGMGFFSCGLIGKRGDGRDLVW
jgi:hypothetical protein